MHKTERHGFWAILEHIAPSVPAGTEFEWSASFADLQTTLRAHGFDHADGIVMTELKNAATWNPGFPWTVSLDGLRVRFTRAAESQAT